MYQPLMLEYQRAKEMVQLKRDFQQHLYQSGYPLNKQKLSWVFSAAISLKCSGLVGPVTNLDEAFFSWQTSDLASIMEYFPKLSYRQLDQIVRRFDFPSRYQAIMDRLAQANQSVTIRTKVYQDNSVDYQVIAGRDRGFILTLPGPVQLKLQRDLRANSDTSQATEKIVTMLLRYQLVLDSGNNQLGVTNYGYLQSLGAKLECFASPFNHSLPNFCSLFPDTDQYFGSLGSFFLLPDSWWTAGIYVANPPYFPEVMNAMSRRIVELLDLVPDLVFYVTIPVWDTTGLQYLGRTAEAERYQGVDYPALSLLVKSGYLVLRHMVAKEQHTYFNYLLDKEINAADTYYLIATNRCLTSPERNAWFSFQ